MQRFSPGGSQSRWKITEIPGSSRVWQAPHGMEIPRGWGSQAKVPSFGGRGYGYFLELHNPFLPLWLLGVLILLWDCKSWRAILIILNPTNKTNIIISYDHFMIILPCQMASLKKVELEAMTMLTILKTISPWMTCTSKELICESRMWWSAKRKTTHYYKSDKWPLLKTDRKTLPKRGTLFKFQVFERVGTSLVEGQVNLSFQSLKRPEKGYKWESDKTTSWVKYRGFSHDVTAAILVFQNNKMLVTIIVCKKANRIKLQWVPPPTPQQMSISERPSNYNRR